MLILRELHDVVGEVPELQIGEAVVAEVLQEARTAGGRLVAHQRAHAHAAHATNTNTAHPHAAAH